MLRFNDLLEKADIDLLRARLVRHKDTRATARRSPHDLWLAADGQFEVYQSVQGEEIFKNCNWIISFVATPLDETLFAGVYAVRGVGIAPAGMIDPLSDHDVGGHFLYDLQPDAALREYSGRIVVDWGKGFRSWVQRPDRQNKAILEIRRVAIEPPFPGFTSFSWSMRELSSVPASWRAALSAVSGVYLLVSRSTGQQYVGSAYGVGGFWARWEDYFRTGHGGNEAMKLVSEGDYQVSVLEFASSSASVEEIIAMEVNWKNKLLTRQFGLNRN